MEFEHTHKVIALQLPLDAPEGFFLTFKSNQARLRRNSAERAIHPGDYIVLRGNEIGVMAREDFEGKYAPIKEKKTRKASQGFFSLRVDAAPSIRDSDEDEDDDQTIDEP